MRRGMCRQKPVLSSLQVIKPLFHWNPNHNTGLDIEDTFVLGNGHSLFLRVTTDLLDTFHSTTSFLIRATRIVFPFKEKPGEVQFTEESLLVSDVIGMKVLGGDKVGQSDGSM